jgi:RimJ/RimL family protein N-acetyltransferase
VSGVPELETERLRMRGWRDADLDWFAAMMADADVAAALGHADPVDPAQAWRDMAFLSGHWALKGFGHWVLERLDTGQPVGRAGLLNPCGWPDLEVGWTVAREHWGNGYAPEAARAACAWAHDELGARHIVSLILPSNANSIRVAEKLGEEVEGRFRLRAFDLRVYGADLPLSGSGAYTRVQSGA